MRIGFAVVFVVLVGGCYTFTLDVGEFVEDGVKKKVRMRGWSFLSKCKVTKSEYDKKEVLEKLFPHTQLADWKGDEAAEVYILSTNAMKLAEKRKVVEQALGKKDRIRKALARKVKPENIQMLDEQRRRTSILIANATSFEKRGGEVPVQIQKILSSFVTASEIYAPSCGKYEWSDVKALLRRSKLTKEEIEKLEREYNELHKKTWKK